MKPSELAKYRFSGKIPEPELPLPVELEGTLIASGNYSHLIDLDVADFSPDPCFGVLLPEGLVDRLSHLEIPLLSGSSVGFVGQATFVCDVWQTGYQMLPYRMTQVYEFTYEDKHVGKHSFHVSYIPYDIYIRSPEDANASLLKNLQPHFERNFTIMELRKHITTRDDILLHRSLEGEQLFDVERSLKDLGVAYELRHVAKGNDWLRQYKEINE